MEIVETMDVVLSNNSASDVTTNIQQSCYERPGLKIEHDSIILYFINNSFNNFTLLTNVP